MKPKKNIVVPIKLVPRTGIHTFDDVIEQGYCRRLSKYIPDAVIGGFYIYDSKDALPYAKKLKNTIYGKNLSVGYLARLLDMWHRACQSFHITTGSCLADDIFTSKKINNESYYYWGNTSDFITDEILDRVQDNHRSLSRKATNEDNILAVECEFDLDPDFYYYVLNRLGWTKFKYSYLVKAVAGALSEA